MKFAPLLGCLFAMTLPAAAAPTLLVSKAQRAAENLPQGCIVTAEQANGGSPSFSVVGKQEPAGIPAEKVIFEIGSISKVFTGVLLAQATLEKKVTLETTLKELMGSSQTFADANVATITLKQLATHTSGLPRIPANLMEGGNPADPYAHYDRAHLDAYLSSAKLDHAGPFPSSYSNLGVGLLSDLLARLYGKSWEDLVIERITKPLGMADTCITLNAEQQRRHAPGYSGDVAVKPWQFGSLVGAGALHSTASDMLKFCQALEHPETSPLKAAIEMTEQRQEGSVGLCLQILKIKDHDSYWFAGGTGGFRSWISVRTTPSSLVVILINNAALAPEDVLSGKTTPLVKPPVADASTAPADPALAAYVGAYDTGVKAGGTDIHYTFEARGADLWMQITGQPFIPLSRQAGAKDRFEFKPVNAEIQFTRKQGEIVSTTLFQGGMEIHAEKLMR